MKRISWFMSVVTVLVIELCCHDALAASASLCAPDEYLYFSCVLVKSRKIISVCGSSPDSHEKNLQYRIGFPDNVQFAYPQSIKDGGDKFYFAEYIRPNVTRQSLRFKNGEYEYTIDVDSNTEEQSPEFTAGVSVHGPKSTVQNCKPKSFKGIDSSISNVARCDSESALNIGKCSDK